MTAETTAVAATGRRDRAGTFRTVAIIAVTAVVIGAVAFLVDRPSDGGGVTGLSLSGTVAAAPPKVGEVPPDFAVTTTDGSIARLSDFAGKPVWLTFGASWCAQCRAEAPDLEATYQRYRAQGLVVFAVFQEEVGSAADYAARVGLTFTVGVDPDTSVASRYDILGIPTHIFIASDGKVQAFRIGGLKPDDMERYVQDLLR